MTEKQKVALVLGHVPAVDEVDQFRLIADQYDINVVCSESICGYLTQNSYFQDLICITVPDHDENPTFLPGLERVLADYDVVIVKERLGLYAYQTVKAKWQHQFRLWVLVDNLTPFAGQDVDQMRTVRQEITNAADAFLVQSDAARHTLELEGIAAERIISLVPWVEKRVKRTKKARAEALKALGIAESSFVIAHFGQIEWEEGLADLVAAIKLAADEDATVARRLRVIFCGVGSYGTELSNNFKMLGLDHVPVYTAPNRKTVETILLGADAQFMCHIPARDRIEGEPFRVVSAMAHELPIIACRSAIIEELCGKHRVDFCVASPVSLAQTLVKAVDSASLLADLAEKNANVVKTKFSTDKARTAMSKGFKQAVALPVVKDKSGIDVRIKEVEGRIQAEQYVDAVNLIESIFAQADIPVHHSANLYRLVGDCFAKLGDVDGAKDAYVQAGNLDPFNSKVWIGLGTVSIIKKKFDLAVLYFQRAVSVAPEDDMASLGLGLSFQGMNELKEATRWVAKALDLNNMNAVAIFTLVQIVSATEQFAVAEKYLRRYLDVVPGDSNMAFTLGGIIFKQQRYAEVEALMNEVLKREPNNERAKILIAQVQQAQTAAEVSSTKKR